MRPRRTRAARTGDPWRPTVAPRLERRDDADEAERLVADGLEAVQLVAGDVDDVAGTDLVDLVAQRHPGAAVLDDDPVVVRMLLAAGLLARLHVEVAHVVVGHLVERADQVVALDALERGVVVGLRRDVVPRALRLAMANEAHGASGYSHSIVPGGLDVMSSTTRLTSRSSPIIRAAICSSRS